MPGNHNASSPIKLNMGNIAHLADRLPIPNYPQAALTNSIIHIGVGGFIWAHQVFYWITWPGRVLLLNGATWE